MKTILVIDDHSPEARHAAAFALVIAQAVYADVLIADTVAANRVNSGEPVLAGRAGEPDETMPFSRGTQLLDRVDPAGAYLPEITELNISDYAIDELIAMINRNEIWMLAAGMPGTRRGGSRRPETGHAVCSEPRALPAFAYPAKLGAQKAAAHGLPG